MQMPESVWYTSPYSSGLRQNEADDLTKYVY